MIHSAIASEIQPSRHWSRHVTVLGTVSCLAVALSLLVWFHGSLGYADGILAGADLRAAMITILWGAVLVFSAVSSAFVALLPARLGALQRYALAYSAGACALLLALRVFDRYF